MGVLRIKNVKYVKSSFRSHHQTWSDNKLTNKGFFKNLFRNLNSH